MLENKEEFDCLTATLNDSGWAIFKRLVEDDMKKHFSNALKSDSKDEAYTSLQMYKAIRDCLQKPYNILKESEFNTQGEK